jgi:hypothetical protein
MFQSKFTSGHLSRKDDTLKFLLILPGRSRWATLLLLACHSAFAQYSVDWFTVDGGGGTTSHGVHEISGTIGRPDAGAMSGDGYSLTGGFWGLYAEQPPVPPLLGLPQ